MDEGRLLSELAEQNSKFKLRKKKKERTKERKKARIKHPRWIMQLLMACFTSATSS